MKRQTILMAVAAVLALGVAVWLAAESAERRTQGIDIADVAGLVDAGNGVLRGESGQAILALGKGRDEKTRSALTGMMRRGIAGSGQLRSPGEISKSRPGGGVTMSAENLPSREAQRTMYDGAEELARKETPHVDGGILRTRLLKTCFKYPLVELDEIVRTDAATGEERATLVIERVADHVMVRTRPGTDEKVLAEALGRHGMAIRKRMHCPGLYLARVSEVRIGAVAEAVAALGTEPVAVAYAEPDSIVHILDLPDDPNITHLWGLDNHGQVTPGYTGHGTPGADIDAVRAWDIGHDSSAVLVGIIDTGIDHTHEDLSGNIWQNPGEVGMDGGGNDRRTNGIDDDGNGYVDDWRGWDFFSDDNDPLDDHFHGTHCAGTIGAVGDNGVGIAGVNWRVSLMGLKFLSATGSGTLSDGVDAIDYATRIGADLTSNSWGTPPGSDGYSQAMVDEIEEAGRQGVLFVAAAGNDNNDNDAKPTYPGAYTCSNIIAVAATDHNDQKAYFSSYGATTVDVGAPGLYIYSTFPSYRTGAMGSRSTHYETISGTSMATPHVAGACALLKAVSPALTGAQVKEKILSGADAVPDLVGKVLTGGRLNVFRALDGAVPGPYVAAWETEMDDGAEGDSAGNGDGMLNPGERVELRVSLRNLGQETAIGVWAVLSVSGSNPYVTIVRDMATFGDIPSSGNRTGSVSYLADVASDTPTPHGIWMDLSIHDGTGRAWTNKVSLEALTSSQVRGTVTKDGMPLEGAMVTLIGPMAVSRVTGSDGTYLAGVVDGTYSVAASKPGYLSTTPVSITTPPGTNGLNFTFSTATVSGRVVDDRTEDPVEGATVSYTGPFSGVSTTGADGAFSCTHVYGRAATLALVVHKSGYADTTPILVAVPPDVSGLEIRLAYPRIGVTPAALNVTAQYGQLPQETMTITNDGSGELTWSSEVGRTFGEIRNDFLHAKNTPYYGVAADGGTNLWISDYSTSIRRLDPATGVTIGSLSVAGAESVVGMAWDGTKLWIVDQKARRIRSVDPVSGAVLKTIEPPVGSSPWGVAAGGGAIWSIDFNESGVVYKYDPETGALLGFVRLPFQSRDITYLNGALWAARHSFDPSDTSLWLHKMDPATGSILKSVNIPDYFLYDVIFQMGIADNGRDSLWALSSDSQSSLDGTGPGRVILRRLGTGDLNWLRIRPDSGNVAGYSGSGVIAVFDSVAAGVGTHATAIRFRSNDPIQPAVDVPVTFSVTESQARVSLTADNITPLTNQTFTVAVNLRTAPPFANRGEYLKFDPARLQLVSQSAGSFATYIPDSRDFSVINALGEGVIRAGGHALLNNAGGHGTLGLFTFRAVATGTTAIVTASKSPTNLFGLALHPAGGGEILPAVDGPLHITVGSGNPDDPRTPTIRLMADNTTPAIGGTFTVTVGLENAPGFRDWGQFLRFDTNRLELVGQAGGSFGGFIADARQVMAGEVRSGGWGLTDNMGGSGTLGLFTFRTLAAGATTVATENMFVTNAFGNLLRVSSGSGVLPVIAGALTIMVGGDGNHAPTIVASASATNGLAPLAVNFTASASDADGDPMSYSWTFGDPSSPGVSNTPSASHVYSNEGTYTATATVSDGRGGLASVSLVITAARTNQLPAVSASGTPLKGRFPLVVTFLANGSDSDGDALSYSWTFGDGWTSTARAPSHVYVASGNYTATVTVDDGHGGTASATVPVYVWPEVRIMECHQICADSQFAVRWEGPTGVFYSVQTTTSLLEGFNDPTTNRVLGNVPLNCYTVPVHQAREMYFRIYVEPEAGPIHR